MARLSQTTRYAFLNQVAREVQFFGKIAKVQCYASSLQDSVGTELTQCINHANQYHCCIQMTCDAGKESAFLAENYLALKVQCIQ